MTWQILKVHPSPLQARVTLINDAPDATPTTDYHAADAVARQTLTGATLTGRGYGITGRAMRHYVSQAY